MTTTTDSKATYASYKISDEACQQVFRQLMAPEAFDICGGVEGWGKLHTAYEFMTAERTRRLTAWLDSI